MRMVQTFAKNRDGLKTCEEWQMHVVSACACNVEWVRCDALTHRWRDQIESGVSLADVCDGGGERPAFCGALHSFDQESGALQRQNHLPKPKHGRNVLQMD